MRLNALLCSITLASCASSDPTPPPAVARDASAAAPDSASTSADAAPRDGDAAAAADDAAGVDAAAGAADAGAADAGAASLPTTRAELIAFVRSGAYASWSAEPAAHRSTGPHGNVRTFVNAPLYTSLKQGQPSHPNGSIAVKELFTGADRTGWAVDVKGEDGVWIYFEGFEPQLDQFYFRGDGNLCANCHAGGVDRVLVPASNFP